MTRSFLVILTCAVVLAACGQPSVPSSQPTVPRASESKPAEPAIAPFEDADWALLAHVVAIRLHHLQQIETSGYNGGDPPKQKRADVDILRIEVFPRQSLIKVSMAESSGFSYCNVNGHPTQFSFLSSPGAKVSGAISDCEKLEPPARVDMAYETRSRLSDHALFIDGTSKIRNIWSGDLVKWVPDLIYTTTGNVELHAAIRLSGKGCQIVSFARSEGWNTTQPPNYLSVDTTSLEATPAATCDLELDSSNGSAPR